MNTTANGLGVPRGTTLSLLKKLTDDYRSGMPRRTQPRPPMRGGDRLGCLFGTGLVVRYLEEYYRRGRPHPTLDRRDDLDERCDERVGPRPSASRSSGRQIA